MSNLKYMNEHELREEISRLGHRIKLLNSQIVTRQSEVGGSRTRLEWAQNYLKEKTATPKGMSQLATDWLEGRARECNPDQCLEFARSGAIGIDIKPLPCSFWALASIRARAYWQFIAGEWHPRQVASGQRSMTASECVGYVSVDEFKETFLHAVTADPGLDWKHDDVRCLGLRIVKETSKVDGHMMVSLEGQPHTKFDFTQAMRDTLLGQIEAGPGVDWTHDSVRCFGQPIHKQTRKVDGHMMVQLGDQHHTRFDLKAEFRKKVDQTERTSKLVDMSHTTPIAGVGHAVDDMSEHEAYLRAREAEERAKFRRSQRPWAAGNALSDGVVGALLLVVGVFALAFEHDHQRLEPDRSCTMQTSATETKDQS